MLHLGDALAGAATAPLQLDQLLTAANAEELQLLSDVLLARRQAAGRECLRLEEQATTEHHQLWFERFLPLLRRFTRECSSKPWAEQLQRAEPGLFQWASPLSAPTPGSAAQPLLPLSSPLAEEVMALHMYAALCTEHAFSLASDHLGGSHGEPGSLDSSWAGGAATARPLTGAPPSGGKEKRKKQGMLHRLVHFRRKAVVDSGDASQGSSSGPAAAADGECCNSPRPGSPYSRTLSRCPTRSSPFAGNAAAASFSAASPTGWEASSLTSPRAPSGSEAAGGLAGAAAWFRRAAGVYGHIEAELLPAAQAAGALPGWDSCPVELWPGLAAALEQLCLAQAQGSAARRAEERGAAPALAASLHRGAADLFETAAAQLLAVQPSSPSCTRRLSARLLRFPAVAALWHTAAAYAQLAEAQRAEEQLGAAVACMGPALGKAREALALCAAEGDWAAALTPDLRRLEKLAEQLDRERAVVYVQKVAPAAGELPPGKVVVSPIAHKADG